MSEAAAISVMRTRYVVTMLCWRPQNTRRIAAAFHLPRAGAAQILSYILLQNRHMYDQALPCQQSMCYTRGTTRLPDAGSQLVSPQPRLSASAAALRGCSAGAAQAAPCQSGLNTTQPLIGPAHAWPLGHDQDSGGWRPSLRGRLIAQSGDGTRARDQQSNSPGGVPAGWSTCPKQRAKRGQGEGRSQQGGARERWCARAAAFYLDKPRHCAPARAKQCGTGAANTQASMQAGGGAPLWQVWISRSGSRAPESSVECVDQLMSTRSM